MAAAAASQPPVGTIQVVDPHPLNWLFITWNTMQEPVRTDERGHLVGAAMQDSRWVDETTLEVQLREGALPGRRRTHRGELPAGV
jgi:hypothetical protein